MFTVGLTGAELILLWRNGFQVKRVDAAPVSAKVVYFVTGRDLFQTVSRAVNQDMPTTSRDLDDSVSAVSGCTCPVPTSRREFGLSVKPQGKSSAHGYRPTTAGSPGYSMTLPQGAVYAESS